MGDGAPTMKAPYIIPFGLREEIDRQAQKFKECNTVFKSFSTTRNKLKFSS